MKPYVAGFTSRFLQMLQYRAAALSGFATQCCWGGIKVMVLAAFYAGHEAPMGLSQAVTYVWLAQGLLALLPWMGDPEVAQAVRTGAVAFDRVRPVDAYAFWFARSLGWTLARLLPRVALMFGFAAVVLPLLGWREWSWQLPADFASALAFMLSAGLALLLSTAMVMLLNILALVAMDARGVNVLTMPWVTLLSGNLLPLALFPDGWQALLLAQPFAGLVDIPLRIHTGGLAGAAAAWAMAWQLGWVVVLVALGRVAMSASLRRLEVQGG